MDSGEIEADRLFDPERAFLSESLGVALPGWERR
jgi:hypothetical protein